MEQKVSKSLKINEAIPYIESYIQTFIEKPQEQGSVLYLCGQPGIGKSDITGQISSNLGVGLCVYYVGTMMMEQMTGVPVASSAIDVNFHKWLSACITKFKNKLPVLEEGESFDDYSTAAQMVSIIPNYSVNEDPDTIKWSKPEIFTLQNMRVQASKNDYIILLLDDAHLINKTMQSYLFQLLTYRSINSHKLPDNVILMLAGNKADSNAGFQQILAPISNRVYFLDVRCDIDDWTENYAIPHHIRPDVTMFLQANDSCLISTPMESQAWPSPRSWTYASQKLDSFERHHSGSDISQIFNIMNGHVGSECASKFIEFKELISKWEARKVLEGKQSYKIKKMDATEIFSYMTAVMTEYIKLLRRKEYDIMDEKPLDIIGGIIQDISETKRAIAPVAFKLLVETPIEGIDPMQKTASIRKNIILKRKQLVTLLNDVVA